MEGESINWLFWIALGIGGYAFSEQFRRWVNGQIINLADRLRDSQADHSTNSTSRTHTTNAPEIYTLSKERDFIPPFTDREWKIGNDTVDWCKYQIGLVLNTEPCQLPDYGAHEDIMVASYICGFIQGQNTAGRILDEWSCNDPALAKHGFIVLTVSAIGMVLGTERGMAAVECLPQLGGTYSDLDQLTQMDMRGGADGMMHAYDLPKQPDRKFYKYLSRISASSDTENSSNIIIN